MPRPWSEVRGQAVADGLLDPHRYHVAWSEEDAQFVATCDAYPSLSWLEDDRLDALAGICALVREVKADG